MKKRTCEIKVRLSRWELQELDRKVKKTGMSREGFIRTLLMNKVPVALPPAPYFDLIKEVRILGNHMRQIAYRAHALHSSDAPMHRENADKVTALADRLTAVCLPHHGDH